MKNIKSFHLKLILFTAVKYHSILHGHVCVMKRGYLVLLMEDGHASQKDGSHSILDLCNTHCLFFRITRPCNVHPLTPHFYIGKLGFTGVYIFF